MTRQKERLFPWGDGRSYVLISNGKEIFKADMNFPLQREKYLIWGKHVAGTQYFSGDVDCETGKFTRVSFPNQKKSASFEETSKWHLIHGEYEDYKKVGARVRVYFVLKIIESVIDALEYRADGKGELDSVMIRMPQGSESHNPSNFSFLIE